MSYVTVSPSNAPINATVSVPGSKSLTNRALVMAALSGQETILKNILLSDDTEVMINALRQLGVGIKQQGNELIVSGGLPSEPRDATFDLNQSGTSIRFLLAVCCLVPGVQTLTGKSSLLSRPIEPLVSALRQLGANIEVNKGELAVLSSTLRGEVVDLDASLSSQFLTALMLIAPIVGLEINITGKLASESYIDITKKLLNDFEVEVNRTNNRVVIPKQTYVKDSYEIEADASAACYFWALAALTEGDVEVIGLDRDSLQGDVHLLDILELYGANVEQTAKGIRVTGRGVLKPVNVDMSNCPDQIQTIAVLAAFASGASKIAGIETLRHKETDRLAATITELAKIGIQASANNGVLSVTGGHPKAAEIDTYDDHRTAMSFALAGTKIEGMRINDPQVVNKTFPEFWEALKSTGVKVS